MTTPPPMRMLYVGPATAERCAQAHAAVEAAKTTRDTLKEIASDLGLSRDALRRLCAAHAAMRRYDVTLTRAGSATLPVCMVVTPKGAQAAAIAAFREFPCTFKHLELDGWTLVVNGRDFALHALRDSLRRAT